MTEKKYRNYQEYFANYLGGWSFADGDKILTIKDVLVQPVRNKDNTTEDRLTVLFAEEDLPLILNRTNADMIAKVTGTSNTGEWIGRKIKLGTERVRAFGDVWDAVRVKNEKITDADLQLATGPQLARLHELIADGSINEPAMLKYYGVSAIDYLSRKDARAIIIQKTGEVIE